jgi:hypothetical protein
MPLNSSIHQGSSDLALQPKGSLAQVQLLMLEGELTNALHEAQRGVIVDLLWLDEINAEGIAILKQGIKLAVQLHKRLL